MKFRMILGSLSLCAVLAASASAQTNTWSPQEYQSGDYFLQQVVTVGDALTVDFDSSNQCDTLLYARTQNATGSERLINAAMWTAFVVRGGNLREAGAVVTPAAEQQIRIPITPNGLQTPVARAFFERMSATPGGLEARTEECVAAFDAAAGSLRAYFVQRAEHLAGKN